jgi:hypothetical protein
VRPRRSEVVAEPQSTHSILGSRAALIRPGAYPQPLWPATRASVARELTEPARPERCKAIVGEALKLVLRRGWQICPRR